MAYVVYNKPLNVKGIYRHLTYILSHYYWVNTSINITQNSLSNNISAKMYFKSKKKQYNTSSYVINYVMLTFSVKTLWMAIYSKVGPNICQVSVHV